MVAAVTGFPARPRLRPHGGPAPSRRYERRRPEKTPLHKVVSENLESWLERRDCAERPVPGHVEEELRGYLECGLLCFGFARAICTTCRTGFVVAFSYKGRGVYPSCNGRHMARDRRPPRRSRPAATEAPASPAALKQARSIRAESPAAESRHVAGDREYWQAARRRHRRAGRRRGCRRTCRGRLLRHSCKAPLARHLANCLGETDGPGGGGVSACVPSVWR